MTRLHHWVDPKKKVYCETTEVIGEGLQATTVVKTEDIAHPRTRNLPAWAHELIPEGYDG